MSDYGDDAAVGKDADEEEDEEEDDEEEERPARIS